MPARRRPRAPLTPASERRLSLRARSLLDTAALRSYLDKHLITIAAGLLLRIAEHTGETAESLMTRLRIGQSRRYQIRRCGEARECARGDVPPPVIKRFLDVNKKKGACILGRDCHCARKQMHPRCENFWLVEIAAGELGNGDGRGALDAQPIKAKMGRSCVMGIDECLCKLKPFRERVRCGNMRQDPTPFDYGLDGEPWFGDDPDDAAA